MRIFRRRSWRRQRLNVFTGRGWFMVLTVAVLIAVLLAAWRAT